MSDKTSSNGARPAPVSRAARFASAESELEAVRRGRKRLDNDLKNGQVLRFIDQATRQPAYVNPATGQPSRHMVEVTTNRPGGFGSDSVAPQRDPVTGYSLIDPVTGYKIPQIDPAILPVARVIYGYAPSAGAWMEITHYPTVKVEYMDNETDIERFIDNEFACYYNCDEAEEWYAENIEEAVPELAARSTERLLYRIDKSRIEDMVKVLSDMRDDRNHPFLERLIEGSLMDWHSAEETWRVFQMLADEIIANLRKKA
jgi:hypothetical protein